MNRPFSAIVLAVLLAACDLSTVEVLGKGASLEIRPGSASPGSDLPLVVHERALLQVTARAADGHVIRPQGLTWSTSDAAVVTVSDRGVVTGEGRGTAKIHVSSGSVRAEVAVSVKARVKIAEFYGAHPCPECDPGDNGAFSLLVGDTLRLKAWYVDIDGAPISEAVPAAWTSSDPGGAGISSEGHVIGLVPNSRGEITAATPDGVGQAWVFVLDEVAGQPATLRLAHGAAGVGPVTFTHDEGVAALSFGEWVDVPISSGRFHVRAEGVPARSTSDRESFGGLVFAGQRLAIYLVGGRWAFLHASLDGPTAVPEDSVRVRLIQGYSDAPVVYVLPPGAPADGLPELCYFDPGDAWGYAQRPAGDLDFVLQGKLFGSQYPAVRIRVSPQPGHSVTYVLTQGSPADPTSIVAFPDP